MLKKQQQSFIYTKMTKLSMGTELNGSKHSISDDPTIFMLSEDEEPQTTEDLWMQMH